MILPKKIMEELPTFFQVQLKNKSSVLFLIDIQTNEQFFLTKHPEIQKKEIKHIEELIGNDNLFNFYEKIGNALLNKKTDISFTCSVAVGGDMLDGECNALLVDRRSKEAGYHLKVAGVLLLSGEPVRCRDSQTNVAKGCPHLEHQKRLMANISHEIRTPMAGVLGLIDLALDTSPNTEQKQYLQSIKECTNSLLRVLNDVIDFSKVNDRKIVLDSIEFDLIELIGDVLRLFALDACRKNIELSCDIASTLPELLIGDPGRIRQILINLIGNAIKFTAYGEVHLDVSISRMLRHHVVLCIKVSDTGIGIKEEDLSRIFNPFEQADSSNTRQFGGVGLGLSISNNLVNAMHGVIEVTSKLGKGSEFTVNIPLGIKTPTTENPKASQPKVPDRILICSPHASIIHTITTYVGKTVSIVACSNPLDAELKIIDAGKKDICYGLVFWDTDMPLPGTGLDASWIREVPGLVVISSALRFSTDSTKCKTSGISAILCKPFTHRDLSKSITQALLQRSDLLSTEIGNSENTSLTADNYTIDNLFQDGHQPTVLVVDDDYYSRTSIVATLERSGYKVQAENNGESAVEHFKPGVFDAVIMDIQMPIMDGLSATKAMRLKEMRHSWVMSSQTNLVPIIGLTADVQASSRDAAELAGMNRILTKPVSRRELLSTLEDEIRNRLEERLIG